MRSIYSYSLDELTSKMLSLGQSTYRSKQIFSWLYKKRVTSFDEMSDISKSFREVLKQEFDFFLPSMEHIRYSKDGTIKCLIKLRDGEMVESVLMHYIYGYAVCVSSEVGCNMSCQFCASGILKKKRALTSEEMLGQVLAYDHLLKEQDPNLRVSHVVIMGTGEPFDNYDSVLSFVRNINSPFGLDIGARHITISTCGIVPKIKIFADEHLQVNLAISLHAPNNELRNILTDLKSLNLLIINYNDALKKYKNAIELSESLKSDKKNASTALWKVEVPANGEKVLTFKARITAL